MEPIGRALMTTAVPLRGNSQSAVSLHDDMTMTVACPDKVRELKSFVPEIRLSLLKYSLKSKTEDIENRPPPVILPCSDFLKVMTSRKRGNAARDDIVDTPRAAFTTLSGSGLNRSQTSDVGSPAKKAREASRVDVSPRKRGNPRVELNRLEDEGSKRSRSDSLQTDRGESNRSKNEHDSVRVSSLGLGRTTERGKRQDVPLKQPVSQGNSEEVRRQKSTTIYSDSDSSSDIGEVHRFAYKQTSSTRDAGSRNNHRGRKYVSSEEEKVQSLDRKSVASPEEIVQRLDPKSVPLPVEKFQRGVAEIPIDPLHGDFVARPMHSNLFSDDEDVKADVQGQLMKVSVDILQKPDGTCSVRCLPDADLHEYVKLQNAKKDKVPVPLTSSSLKVVDPAKVKCVHMYPGVQFYKTVQTEHVKMGRLKIDPRTIKPVETLSKYEMVLTALSGCVIIKSVQFKLTSTGIPALKSCELPEGHELKIPNGSSYSIENWEDVQALLLFCLISN